MKIGSLNVRHVAGAKDALYLCSMAQRMHLDVLLLQSTNCDCTQGQHGYTYFSQRHVGIIYKTQLDLDISVDPSARILVASTTDLTLISAYCPFNDQDAQTRFWEHLHHQLTHTNTHDTLLMGDFNAHIALSDLRQHGHDTRTTNDDTSYPPHTDQNGHALLQVALNYDLSIRNFEQKARFQQRITCRNHNGNSIIDYCLSHLTTSHCTGVSVKTPMYQTDHNMLIAHLNIKHTPHRARPTHAEPHPIPLEGPPAFKAARIELEQRKQPRPKHVHTPYLSANTRRLNRQYHRATDPQHRADLKKQTQLSQRTDWKHYLHKLGAQIQTHAERQELREAYKLLRPWTRPRSKRTPPSTASLKRLTTQLSHILTRQIPGPTIDVTIEARPNDVPNRTKVEAYTDGSCKRQQHTMGWASLVTSGPTIGQALMNGTTSPRASATRAEALAILQLAQAHRGMDLIVYTDSKNCVDALRSLRRAIAGEFANTKNEDVWRQIAREIGQHATRLTLIKIPGHKGILGNELCDRMANFGRLNPVPQQTHITQINTDTLEDPYLLTQCQPTHDIQWENTPVTPLSLLDGTPTPLEIDTATSQLHACKAPGLDDLTAEDLKEPEIRTLIIEAIQEVWDTKQIPAEWSHTKLVALPKPDGGVRGIALTSAFSKILTRIILNRYADTNVGAEQFAFRPAKNTCQAIIALQQALHKCWALQKAAFALFIDVAKAYDSVSRDSLASVLTAYGVGPNARALISHLYEDEIHIYDAGQCLPNSGFRSTCGVKQGCILSPWIFILYMDIILRNTKRAHPNAFVLLYADDIAIATKSLQEMQRIATTLETEMAQFGLSINMKKTLLMPQDYTDTQDSLWGYESRLQKLGITEDLEGLTTALPRCRRGQRATEILIPTTPGTLRCPLRDCGFKARIELKTPPPTGLLTHCKTVHPRLVSRQATIVRLPHVIPNNTPTANRRLIKQTNLDNTITLRGGLVKLCTSYRYLGKWLTFDDSDSLDITNRINAASRAFWALKHIWRAKNIRRWWKAQLLKTLVLPVLLYGSGTWAVTDTDLDRLRSFYHMVARKAGNFRGTPTEDGWRIASATMVREHMRLPLIEHVLREERLRLFGQLLRLDNNVARVARSQCNGHHRRGYMRKCWWTQVREDMAAVQLTSADAKRTHWTVASKAPRPGTIPAAAQTSDEDSNASEEHDPAVPPTSQQ